MKTWEGDDDPYNPYNWRLWRINVSSFLLALLTFLGRFSSAIMAPATPAILAEFGSDDQLLETFVVSSFVLAVCCPSVRWVYISAFLYALTYSLPDGFGSFDMGASFRNLRSYTCLSYHQCGFPCLHHWVRRGAIFGQPHRLPISRWVFRLLHNGKWGASFGDMIPQERRAAYMSVFIMGPILGPVAGPIGGGFLASAKGWHWVFWLVAIAGGFNAVMMAIFYRETYAPLILRRENRRSEARLLLNSGSELSPWAGLRRGIRRPFKLLVLSPLGALLALYMALIYGFLYHLISSISQVFVHTYGFSSNLSGLAYLGLGIGCLSGYLLVSLTSDRYMLRRADKYGGERKPEYRNQWIPLGAICLPAGFFIYEWAAEYHVHWIVPIIGTLVIGFGFNTCFNSLLLYLVESFTIFAASALAANGVVRNIGGGHLPLAGLTLYDDLGVGWGNSVLGFIQLGLVLPMTFVLVRYGDYLRDTYALKDL